MIQHEKPKISVFIATSIDGYIAKKICEQAELFTGDIAHLIEKLHAEGIKHIQDDMNFTSSQLSTITAKTLIMQGDRDPLYPIDITIDMYKSIPNAFLWIIPNGGHVPVTDKLKPSFLSYLNWFLK